MIEFVQGPNNINQQELIDEKIIDNVRDILVLLNKESLMAKKNIKLEDDELVIFNT